MKRNQRDRASIKALKKFIANEQIEINLLFKDCKDETVSCPLGSNSLKKIDLFLI